ncbi:MAG: hypothetical protein IK062_02340 [Selenomonadaceae bacterium]|nr:hypothetical protein [Selenomonadaceae bacterium]
MTREEIFENRREVGKKLCEQIRKNDGQMINAKNFSERPYYGGTKKYKFSTANYLRLMSAESIYTDPHWYKICDIENNKWTLKNDAKFELLEEWQENSSDGQECFLTKFYNALEIEETEKYFSENKKLEDVLEFLQIRGLIERDSEVISLKDGIDAVKNYSEKFVSDELTINFAVQMWIAESKLKTKIKKFLPVYSEEILTEIEKTPDKIFESVNKAQAILKNLRREKIFQIEKLASEELFQNLKIIYHGSESELKTKDRFIYKSETIFKGVSAYEFLLALKSAEKQKIWLEFFYKDYAHGKFLISEEDFKLIAEENVTDFLKKRLNKNRQQILENPQELGKYISPNVMVRTEDLLNQINLESENFQSAMKIFEQEEFQYLQSP